MTPLEAYRVLSSMHHDLAALRIAAYPGSKGYSNTEIQAQVIAFEALRQMEEKENEKQVNRKNRVRR